VVLARLDADQMVADEWQNCSHRAYYGLCGYPGKTSLLGQDRQRGEWKRGSPAMGIIYVIRAITGMRICSRPHRLYISGHPSGRSRLRAGGFEMGSQ